MRNLTTFLGIILILSCFTPVFAQDCPAPGELRYAASDFQRLGQSYGLKLNKFNGNNCPFAYLLINEGAYLDIYEDGSAILTGIGTVDDICDEFDNEQWEINVSFTPITSTEPFNPIGNPDISLWQFFDIIPETSYLKNLASGELISLSNSGLSAQLGQGANGKTDTFGFLASFSYQRSAGFFGSGEISVDLSPIECPDEPIACELDFKTYAHGGWGSKPAGNNPGKYLHDNFNAAFPEGLTLGCNKSLKLTCAQAITDFLPSGGKPKKLKKSVTNPRKKLGVLAGQTVALALNVGFDRYDADFSGSSTLLADAYVAKGKLQGWTVQEVLDEANKTLGGCKGSTKAKKLIKVVTAINESFEEGSQSNDYLSCEKILPSECDDEDEQEDDDKDKDKGKGKGKDKDDDKDKDRDDEDENCNYANIKIKVYPNPTVRTAKLSVNYEGEDIDYTYIVTDIYGNKVLQSSSPSSDESMLDFSSLPSNRYIIRIESKKGVKNVTILKK